LKEEEAAALRIQSLYRGGKDRKAVKAMAEQEARADTWPTWSCFNPWTTPQVVSTYTNIFKHIEQKLKIGQVPLWFHSPPVYPLVYFHVRSILFNFANLKEDPCKQL